MNQKESQRDYDRYSKEQLISLLHHLEKAENVAVIHYMISQWILCVDQERLRQALDKSNQDQWEYFGLLKEYSQKQSDLVKKYAIPVVNNEFKVMDLLRAATDTEKADLFQLARKIETARIRYEQSEKAWLKEIEKEEKNDENT